MTNLGYFPSGGAKNLLRSWLACQSSKSGQNPSNNFISYTARTNK